MVEIIPSILTAVPEEFRKMIDQVEGNARRVHVDIIDGVFANNKTIVPENSQDIETNLFIDYHLMVDNPVEWLFKCRHKKGDRVIAQIERMPDQVEFLDTAMELGFEVGLALDIDSSVSNIMPEIIKDLDLILVMGVKAGFGGQKFETSCLQKIKELDQYKICVDGGITIENIHDVIAAGADEVVIGRKLFEGDIEKNIQKFEYAAEK